MNPGFLEEAFQFAAQLCHKHTFRKKPPEIRHHFLTRTVSSQMLKLTSLLAVQLVEQIPFCRMLSQVFLPPNEYFSKLLIIPFTNLYCYAYSWQLVSG